MASSSSVLRNAHSMFDNWMIDTQETGGTSFVLEYMLSGSVIMNINLN